MLIHKFGDSLLELLAPKNLAWLLMVEWVRKAQ